MKVAIWASCNFGNYGDDVMAIMFAKTVQNAGGEPFVYRLDKKLAERYKIKSVDTIDELLDNATFSMIAGGSWLEKRLFESTYVTDFEKYLTGLNKYNCPFYVISIGGDGIDKPELMADIKQKIFSSPLLKGGTVRLKDDVTLMEKLGKNVELYPDVVLSIPHFFKVEKKEKGKKFKIGLSISENRKNIFPLINKLIRFIHPEFEFYFIKSHLPEYNINYELQVEEESERCKNITYTDVDSFVNQIASLNVVVSYKLHPGVSAAAYGVPFILLNGLDKTQVFLRSVNSSKAIVLGYNKLLRKIITGNIKSAKECLDFNEIKKQQEQSYNHILFLEKLVKQYKASL